MTRFFNNDLIINYLDKSFSKLEFDKISDDETILNKVTKISVSSKSDTYFNIIIINYEFERPNYLSELQLKDTYFNHLTILFEQNGYTEQRFSFNMMFNDDLEQTIIERLTNDDSIHALHIDLNNDIKNFLMDLEVNILDCL